MKFVRSKLLLGLLSLFFLINLEARGSRNKNKEVDLHSTIKSLLKDVISDGGGGCSNSKAINMAKLIAHENLKTTVDVGVYRGRSLFPQALAHKLFTGGVVYGVDPYSSKEAFQHDQGGAQEALDFFAINTDFEGIYQEVTNFLIAQELDQNALLIRMRSDDAAAYFKEKQIQFDLVHIDGNHDTNMVMKDVELYLDLIVPGGYLVMDDISWTSIKPAVNLALKSCIPVFEDRGRGNGDYLILKKKI